MHCVTDEWHSLTAYARFGFSSTGQSTLQSLFTVCRPHDCVCQSAGCQALGRPRVEYAANDKPNTRCYELRLSTIYPWDE
jgi:hypothetical protein